MARIAERAGVSKERLYNYFGDKRALFHGVLADDLDPADLVFLLIALAASWHFVPQLAQMITGADGADPAERARRRAFVARSAERLTSPVANG